MQYFFSIKFIFFSHHLPIKPFGHKKDASAMCRSIFPLVIYTVHYDDRTTFRSLLSPDFFEALLKGGNPGIKANAPLLQVLSVLSVLCKCLVPVLYSFLLAKDLKSSVTASLVLPSR